MLIQGREGCNDVMVRLPRVLQEQGAKEYMLESDGIYHLLLLN